MRIIRETTEKITETLTEQKTTDNLGLIKKIETRNFVSESSNGERADSTPDPQTEDISSLDGDAGGVKQLGDDLFVFDRTKSYNISKRMKKYDDEVAAGFITDVDSKRIINQAKRFPSYFFHILLFLSRNPNRK